MTGFEGNQGLYLFENILERIFEMIFLKIIFSRWCFSRWSFWGWSFWDYLSDVVLLRCLFQMIFLRGTFWFFFGDLSAVIFWDDLIDMIFLEMNILRWSFWYLCVCFFCFRFHRWEGVGRGGQRSGWLSQTALKLSPPSFRSDALGTTGVISLRLRNEM